MIVKMIGGWWKWRHITEKLQEMFNKKLKEEGKKSKLNGQHNI